MESSTPLPFYKTRKFWRALLLSFIVLFSAPFAYFSGMPDSIESTVFLLNFSLGGGLYIFFGASLLGQIGALLTAILYLPTFAIFLIYLYKGKRFNFIIAIIAFASFAIGMIYAYLLASSF